MKLIIRLTILALAASVLWLIADVFFGASLVNHDGSINREALAGLFIGCSVSALSGDVFDNQGESE